MATKEYELAIKIAGKIDKSLTESTGLTRKELNAIAREAANAATGTKQNFQSGLKEVEPFFTSMKSFAGRTFRAMTTAAKFAGAGIAAGLGASVKVGSDFEQQMSTVEAITMASGEEMAAMTEKAKNLGATTSFTAEEVGEAMEYMGMAGWKAEQITSGIEGVMSLAAASGEDIGTVSDIVTDAMTAFGLGADKVDRFSDVLAATATNANTNVGMMGETFKYVAPIAGSMGYSIEDMAVAIGLMANSGIKATQAGTSLRRIITNMAAPTKSVNEAMDALGVSLVAEDGHAKSFYEVMQDIRAGMSGLVQPTEEQLASLAELEEAYDSGSITEDEFTAKQDDLLASIYGAEGAMKAAAASGLAGKNAMSGFLALVNASDEDFDKLTTAIYNSEGAAAAMQDIKLDNLAGDVTILKSAMDGLGIEVYDQVKDPLRDLTQAGTSFISDVTSELADSGAISTFITGLQEALPGVIQTIKDFGGALDDWTKPLQNVGGWLIEHPDVIQGLIAGIGGAFATYEVISKMSSFVSSFKSLKLVLTNPWATAILAVTAAIGGIIGVWTGIKARTAERRAEEMATHFGDIQLSLKDLKTAADNIIDNGTLTSLNEALASFDLSESNVANINAAVTELNKANWKVSIGMELTEQDQEDYEAAISNYVTAVQKSVENESYGIHLMMDFVASNTDDTEQGANAKSAIDKVEEFYRGKQQQLTDLGKELNEYVTTAFNDGLLDINETEHIQKLQKQMADIQAALASSGYGAALERIGMGYSGKELTSESFQNLQAEIKKASDDAKKAYDEAFEHSYAAITTAYESGESGMTKQEYEDAMAAARKTYLDNLAQVELQAQQFSLNTIMDTYGEQIAEAAPEFAAEFGALMDEMENNSDFSVGRLWSWLDSISDEKFLDSDVRANIEKLLEGLQPTNEELEGLVAQYKKHGIEVPEALSGGLKDAAALTALTGDVDAMFTLVQDEIVNSPEKLALLQQTTVEGSAVPDSFKDAIINGQADINAAIDADYQSTQDYINTVFSNGFDTRTVIRVAATTETTVGNNPAGYAGGGIITRPELAWIAEGGYPESVIPWDGSQRALDLWTETGKAIGALNDSDNIVSQWASDSFDAPGTGMVITYSPTLQFYGGAPSKTDIVEAGRISQQEFNQMMARYERDRHRFTLA